jgi:hypothetical protein
MRVSPVVIAVVEFRDAYTDQEMRLEPVPVPVFFTVKLPLTAPPAVLPAGGGTAVTVYMGPATATALTEEAIPTVASSAACTVATI